MSSTLAKTGQQSFGQSQLDVTTRIKNEIYKKSIRIKDYFQDFDRLRKGIITLDKFKSVLVLLNLYLSEDDVNQLVETYRVSVDQVNYINFCNDVNDVFNNEEFQKTYNKQLRDMDQDITRVLTAFQQIIQTKRILLKAPFQDFDRTKSSRITVDQFSRVLQSLGILPNNQAFERLVAHYSDNGREINYVRFCQDVDNVNEYNRQAAVGNKINSNTSYVQQQDHDNLNLLTNRFVSNKKTGGYEVSAVEQKIQAVVVMKQLRINEFFKDYDTLRKGTVSETQFHRILKQTNIELSQHDLQLLLNKYKQPSGLVNYSDFCVAIDRVFTEKQIDKQPQYQVQQIDRTTTLPARRAFLGFSQEQQAAFDNLCDAYRTQIKNKRMLLKPHFQDFDKTKGGYISKNQFLRILNQFSLYPDEQALNLLLMKYVDNGNLDEVNYYLFCKDVDIYDEGVQISSNHAQSFVDFKKVDKQPFDTILQDQPKDIQDLISRLRCKVKEYRIRVREFLRDFDKLRCGGITNNQFRLGLNLAKLPLSNVEYELLVEHFKFPKKENHVSWTQFCDVLDEVFQVKGLEKDDPSKEITSHNLDFHYGRPTVNDKDLQCISNFQRRFTKFCITNRLDIKQFFKDWDRLDRRKVSVKQFRQVLATVNFPVSNDEFDALTKAYSSKDDANILYIDFINDNFKPQETLDQQNERMFQTQNEKSSSYQENRVVKQCDVTELMERLKKQVKINNLRVQEYFRDFDPLRKGVIPGNKFRGILSNMKIHLSEDELNNLESVYQLPGDATQVNIDRFHKDLEAVFTETALDKNPLVRPQQYQPPKYTDLQNQLSGFEEEALHQFFLRLGEVVRKHRIHLKPHFQDKDRARSGKISFTRLRSILDFHKLPLTEEQFKLLSKRFSFEGREFNYVEFDEVLKNYEASA